jgi:chromosome segregation ATPase
MTDEINFGATHDRTKLAVLREAIDRADNLATVQAQLISSQEQHIQDLKARVKFLESELAEARTALKYD